VVIDVAMTETARLAHYVLPAASQFEKWEATGFNLDFPDNYFHLRKPLFEPPAEALPEPEIYTRLVEKMGLIPKSFPLLSRIARREPRALARWGYMAALALTLVRHKEWIPYAGSIVYRTLGPTLPEGAAAAAPLLPLTIEYATRHADAVRRAGHEGNRLTLGNALFEAILAGHSGVLMSRNEYEDTWTLIGTDDRRVHLAVPEMLEALRALSNEAPVREDYPFILMAGERRSYNANQIYRDPAWRKVDKEGALRMHPDDAATLGLADDSRVICKTERAELEVVVEIDDSLRRGVVTLPHGYGMRYKDSEPLGPAINRLTSTAHCDPFTRTPYHKYVPAQLRKVDRAPMQEVA
jgi:anaerobic selenocysteine-containing dehydrogenase